MVDDNNGDDDDYDNGGMNININNIRLS